MFTHYDTPSLWLSAGAVVFLLASSFIAVRRLRTGPPLSRVGVGLAAAPSFIAVGLFYSLALHMRWSLGKWPAAIGDEGLSPALISHEGIVGSYLQVLFGVTLIPWSLAFIFSLLERRWRRFSVYLGIHALSCALCVGLALLAPAPFLAWWWD